MIIHIFKLIMQLLFRIKILVGGGILLAQTTAKIHIELD